MRHNIRPVLDRKPALQNIKLLKIATIMSIKQMPI